ncbi:hypothetical protein Bpfe_023443 [Biomphalaria pfeifferi]|uniref:Uncharacterized protein n=1 Tax=Biomphalaria pfeifferi TaxID=112525 RepID=A0AAD8B364_BIOPF|nr:hypothetical protein Bpfe_023443 [Biomphalaria pfeifferi]
MINSLILLVAFGLMVSSVLCDVTVIRPLPLRARGVYAGRYGGPAYIEGDWDDNGYVLAGDHGVRGLSVLPPSYGDGYDGYDDGYGRYIGGRGGVFRRYERRLVQRVGRY